MKESVRGDVTNRTEDNILKQDKTSIKGKHKKERFKKMEKEKTNYNNINPKEYINKKIKIIIITIFSIIFLLIISTIFAILNIGKETIINGVSIEGIDVSGLSKTEAIDKLNNLKKKKKEKEIGLKYENYVTTLNLTVMEVLLLYHQLSV